MQLRQAEWASKTNGMDAIRTAVENGTGNMQDIEGCERRLAQYETSK
jgi:hypothetical protein